MKDITKILFDTDKKDWEDIYKREVDKRQALQNEQQKLGLRQLELTNQTKE